MSDKNGPTKVEFDVMTVEGQQCRRHRNPDN